MQTKTLTIQDVWQQIIAFQRMVDSMPKRYQAVIEAKGHVTKY